MLILIAKKKGFDALNTKQKKTQHCAKYHFWKNQEKPAQNGKKWFKMSIMSRFFLIFYIIFFMLVLLSAHIENFSITISGI